MNNIDGVIHKKNFSLKKYNTFRIKAIAKDFYIPENIDGFINILKYLKQNNKDYMILGGGSNILFLDKVIEKSIIYTGFFTRIENSTKTIRAYSGANVIDVVKNAYKNSFTGLEFLYGLPGSIGGATFMNARCYKHSISEFIEKIGIIDDNLEYRTIKVYECEYDYKQSIFMKKDYIIIDVLFQLDKGNKKIIKSNMKKYIRDRKSKHQFKYPSAGSTFLNDYSTNMIAGKVIDELNLRGLRIGGAIVSPYHANFIVNYKNATGEDVYNLINKVKEEVYKKIKINIHPEVRIISNDIRKNQL